VNLYANNVDKNRNVFFKKENNFIENYAIGILIVGGDLNDTLTCMVYFNSFFFIKIETPLD
jgi:hypothetical protein